MLNAEKLNEHDDNQTTSKGAKLAWGCLLAVAGLAGMSISSLVYAQGASFSQLTTTLQHIVALLSGAGVLVVTVAIAWAGYKMIFQHARWSDVATIVLGAVLIGGATTAAQWLVG
ncbi:TrbC/VirB2 family protein [Burkholderia territorii]|uniref:TrbC/VirB2 family protein n=1 Tax=Burkholderia territorii TaxID=1503055 RepID=UPI000A7C24F4|nr:TrbC/VirB2 family protein [Burkholderia territorii]